MRSKTLLFSAVLSRNTIEGLGILAAALVVLGLRFLMAGQAQLELKGNHRLSFRQKTTDTERPTMAQEAAGAAGRETEEAGPRFTDGTLLRLLPPLV